MDETLVEWRKHKREAVHDYDRKLELTKDGIPCPTTAQIGLKLVEAGDAISISLLGGMSHGSVAFTKDQNKAFERWFPTDDSEPTNELERAGSFRNLMRHVEAHGVRLMGFLAGRRLLEPGRDPVLTLAEMLEDYLEEPVVDLTEEEETT